MKKLLIVGLLLVFCIISVAAVSGSTVNYPGPYTTTFDNANHNDANDNNVNQNDNSHSNAPLNISGPVISDKPLNISGPVTSDSDAKIAALESHIAEQNKKIEQQGNILDQIVNFLRNVLGWK